MTKNKISDLNNHLFAQLEKLSEEDLTAENLEKEISRSKAISSLSAQIIEAQRISLDVIKEAYKQGISMTETSPGKLLLDKKNTEE